MAKDWYLRQDGKTFGPLTSEKLKSLASDGRMRPDGEVANDTNGPWHPAAKLKGLEFVTPTRVEREVPPPIKHEPQNAVESKPVATMVPAVKPSLSTKSESDVWTGRPSQITNLKTFILCGLFFWLVIPIFVAIWRYLMVQTIRYELTTQRFRLSYGVLSRRTDELELYRIKDTAFSQTIFQRFFGLGTVTMTSSDSSTPFAAIDSIPVSSAKELRETIRTFVEELRDRKRVREIDYA